MCNFLDFAFLVFRIRFCIIIIIQAEYLTLFLKLSRHLTKPHLTEKEANKCG